MHSSIRHNLRIRANWKNKPDLVWKIYNVLTSIQSQNVSKSRAGTIQNVNEQQFLNQWRKYFSFRFTSCFQFMPVSVTKGTELSRSRIDTLKITFQKMTSNIQSNDNMSGEKFTRKWLGIFSIKGATCWSMSRFATSSFIFVSNWTIPISISFSILCLFWLLPTFWRLSRDLRP